MAESFDGKMVWEGVVEVFLLIAYANAKRCYAWSYNEGNETKHVIVFEKPPITSPVEAVRAYIVSLSKR